MEMIDTKHRKIVNTLLVFLIERAKEVETLLLELDNDDDACDKMCDRIYEIIEKEGNENDIENEVEKFMKEYGL